MTDQRGLAARTERAARVDGSERIDGVQSNGHHEPSGNRFGVIAERLIDWFAPSTSYDAGCSQGFLVRALVERGVDARGGDISELAVSSAPAGLVDRLEVRDLREPLGARYDLISCLDVLENMSAADAQTALDNICAATDLVVLSSAPDEFAEPTHINVRQPAHWATDFARRGFFRRTEVDASFISPWAVVYGRSRPTTVELVGAYESLLAPLGRELSTKRQALLAVGRELDEARSPVNAALAEMARAQADLTAERDAAVAERHRLAADLQELGQADLNAERMARLAMADELVGLRAELAQVRVHTEASVGSAGRAAVNLREIAEDLGADLVRTQADLAEARRVVAEMTASATWRIGRFALLPVRMARIPRRVLRGVLRRARLLRR